jgi:hypothetical protein
MVDTPGLYQTQPRDLALVATGRPGRYEILLMIVNPTPQP